MFTEEQLTERQNIIDEFEIDSNKDLREKAKHDISEKLRLREHEKKLIHNGSGDTTTTEGEK